MADSVRVIPAYREHSVITQVTWPARHAADATGFCRVTGTGVRNRREADRR